MSPFTQQTWGGLAPLPFPFVPQGHIPSSENVQGGAPFPFPLSLPYCPGMHSDSDSFCTMDFLIGFVSSKKVKN